MTIDRRQFHRSLATLAFGGVAAACSTRMSQSAIAPDTIYGPLLPDPAGLIDLPRGFSYRTLSSFGETMSDGYLVPDRADGMGCIRLDRRRIALVRNHELNVSHQPRGAFSGPGPADFVAYDRRGDNGAILPGGTTTLVLDARSLAVEAQYLSLTGTIRNCAGGVTPWGSWLTCEEDISLPGASAGKDHGWVFEVPAAHRGLANPQPLKALGRFNHEAACVDPRTGIVYLTEDREDSLFYRLLPTTPGRLAAGGRLQALAFTDPARSDSRNWSDAWMVQGAWHDASWIDLDGTDAPGQDDLRLRGGQRGAALFARGEGIWWGDGELYFTCTSGGAARLSQIMRYRPSSREGQSDEANRPGRLQLFVESTDGSQLNFGDNLTVAPNGHLLVCEDQYTDGAVNHIRGVTPDGGLYPFARIRIATEPAGACFSPDGRTMFVNLYAPTRTLAISGPWA